ncbi:unnamed protein product [Gongylonema pulchrum]|uniref:Secreted protein n=1 Tax=Gongylonema pulchrum TaxID=637853 RepID=A0A183ESX3_9BILA|nr:unnamed protein product [Gongylonema pulchrum]
MYGAVRTTFLFLALLTLLLLFPLFSAFPVVAAIFQSFSFSPAPMLISFLIWILTVEPVGPEFSIGDDD